MLLRLAAVAAFAALVFAAPARADLLIQIDKSTQQMTVSADGEQLYTWPVSTGVAGYDTPAGAFNPFRMEKDHYSAEWDDAPMPYSIFFTQKGHAIHGTNHRNLGRPASHGCVRLSVKNASTLWGLVRKHKMAHTIVRAHRRRSPAVRACRRWRAPRASIRTATSLPTNRRRAAPRPAGAAMPTTRAIIPHGLIIRGAACSAASRSAGEHEAVVLDQGQVTELVLSLQLIHQRHREFAMPKSRKRRSTSRRAKTPLTGRARPRRLLPHPGAAAHRVRLLPKPGRRLRAAASNASPEGAPTVPGTRRNGWSAKRKRIAPASGLRPTRRPRARCSRSSARYRAISAATASSPSRAARSRRAKSRRRRCGARKLPTSRRRRPPCASGGGRAHDPQAPRAASTGSIRGK